jgi:hypothetical protein
MLSIKAKALATFYKIKEVQDSKDKASKGVETQ